MTTKSLKKLSTRKWIKWVRINSRNRKLKEPSEDGSFFYQLKTHRASISKQWPKNYSVQNQKSDDCIYH